MDKKNNYIRFRHILNLWMLALEQLKEDTKQVLSGGELDFQKYPFGQHLYRFHSVRDNLYPIKAYIDKDGDICIEAVHVLEKYTKVTKLDWDDVIQDIITLSDFMDCVYDNVDLRYDSEIEAKMEDFGQPCQLLAIAQTVLRQLSDQSARDADHQDIVAFLSGCADEAAKWCEVKRLANSEDNNLDWERATEKVQPLYFG